MKNSNVCTKCGSDHLCFIPSRFYGHNKNEIFFCAAYYSSFSAVSIGACICRNCGYVENWIKTDDELKECILYVGVNNNEEE